MPDRDTESAATAHRNQLGSSTSPYLQQHRDNPVHWQEWNAEALDRAKREQRPILLSIGYSACHWCHVMAHESFEDEATAAVINEHFVSIKVDREERPDIDGIYQKVVQMMGQGGGWPLTVFLTPDQKPYYGGTYFPKQASHGRPAFTELLETMAGLHATRPDEVARQVEAFAQGYQALATIVEEEAVRLGVDAPLDGDVALPASVRLVLERIDPEWGGLGRQPKFPNASALELLLAGARAGIGLSEKCEQALRLTLDKMYQGGIYDHLGGGFARYSVDQKWLVPHFEKMLSDNAQLLPLYAVAAQRWPEAAHYRRAAEQIVDYLAREMRTADGRFYAATDADSEGVEGKYFSWTPDEIRDVVGDDELAALVCHVYGVTEDGNFEHGLSVLHLPETIATRATERGVAEEVLRSELAPALAKLLERRTTRVPPLRDEKILTSWNALLVSGLVRSSEAFSTVDAVRSEQFLDLAVSCGRALVGSHVQGGQSGPVLAVLRSGFGGEVRLRGVIDDVAYLARACLDLHEATLDASWRRWAVALSEHAVEQYALASDDGFFVTASDAEVLIERAQSEHDGAIPSGTGVMLEVLLRLEAEDTDGSATRFARMIEGLLRRYRAAAAQPLGFASILCASRLGSPAAAHVTIEGPSEQDANARALWNAVRAARAGAAFPITIAYRGGGEARAIVCKNQTCAPPVLRAEALSAELGATP